MFVQVWKHRQGRLAITVWGSPPGGPSQWARLGEAFLEAHVWQVAARRARWTPPLRRVAKPAAKKPAAKKVPAKKGGR